MKKKILIIIGSLEIGGTEKQLLSILKKISNSFDIKIFTIHKKGVLAESFSKLGVEIIESNINLRRSFNLIYKIPFFYMQLVKLFRNFKPDITHFFLLASYILGSPLMFFFRKSFFIMSRRSLNNYQKKYFFIRFIELFLHKKVDLIIANSKAVFRQLIEEENVNKKKCKVIYNGVSIRKRVKKNNKIIKIICLSNLIPYKNHKFLLNTLSKIKKANKWELILVGSGKVEQINKIKKQIIELKIKNSVKLYGSKTNVDFYLNQADIGVLVSNEEGFSNTILEYMSFSLPVIATDVGGNSEAIADNDSGFLIKPNDIDQLKEKIEILLEKKRTRILMGRKGLIRAKSLFNLNKASIIYKNLYNNVKKLN